VPRGNFSKTAAVVIGAVEMRTPAPESRILSGYWENFHAEDWHGVAWQHEGLTGRARTIRLPHENEGGGVRLRLVFLRYSFEVWAALDALFENGHAFDLVVPLENGWTFTGRAKPDRRDGAAPLEAPGAVELRGGQGSNLRVQVVTTEGSLEVSP
jgi:hypothetical protein